MCVLSWKKASDRNFRDDVRANGSIEWELPDWSNIIPQIKIVIHSAVHAAIKADRSDMKADLHSFYDGFAIEIESDLASFREDVNGKLN